MTATLPTLAPMPLIDQINLLNADAIFLRTAYYVFQSAGATDELLEHLTAEYEVTARHEENLIDLLDHADQLAERI